MGKKGRSGCSAGLAAGVSLVLFAPCAAFRGSLLPSRGETSLLLHASASEEPIRPRATRRDRLADSLLWSSSIVLTGFPWVAAAAAEGKQQRIKGAFELDLEYYLQDLLRGNPSTGVEQSSIQVRPARRITSDLATFLDGLTLDEISRVSGLPRGEVLSKVGALRRAVEPAFKRRTPFESGDLGDEYFFDMAQYASFRVAAKEIPNLNDRVTFVRSIGDKVLRKITEDLDSQSILLDGKPIGPVRTSDAVREGLEGCLDGMGTILRYMQAKGFVRAYKVNAQDYDLESWSSGFPIEIQVSVYEPATLGGNLQFTGEGMLFHPDYIQETLMAYVRKCHVSKAKSFQFFLDTEYRENPKDYAPTEVLYSMPMERGASS